MRSEWRSFPLATITFLGERSDITGPEPGVLVAEQTMERHQRVDDMSGHARNVTHRAGLLILSRAVALYTFGFGTRRGSSLCTAEVSAVGPGSDVPHMEPTSSRHRTFDACRGAPVRSHGEAEVAGELAGEFFVASKLDVAVRQVGLGVDPSAGEEHEGERVGPDGGVSIVEIVHEAGPPIDNSSEPPLDIQRRAPLPRRVRSGAPEIVDLSHRHTASPATTRPMSGMCKQGGPAAELDLVAMELGHTDTDDTTCRRDRRPSI